MRKNTIISAAILLLLGLCSCHEKQNSVAEINTQSDTATAAEDNEILDTAKSVSTVRIWFDENDDKEKKILNLYSKNPLRREYFAYCKDSVDNVMERDYDIEMVRLNKADYGDVNFSLCLEDDFCNDKVFKRMETAIDTTFINLLEYWIPRYTLKQLRYANAIKDVEGIFNFAERASQWLHRKKGIDYGPSFIDYSYSGNGFVTLVCRKVFETPDMVTYGIFTDGYYYGTCGNTEQIRYYTIEKATGHVLTIKDILKKHSKEKLNEKIWNEVKPWKPDDNGYYADLDYVSLANGCAIVKDGVLFYFFPYNIGCAAEGQFNIVVQL